MYSEFRLPVFDGELAVPTVPWVEPARRWQRVRNMFSLSTTEPTNLLRHVGFPSWCRIDEVSCISTAAAGGGLSLGIVSRSRFRMWRNAFYSSLRRGADSLFKRSLPQNLLLTPGGTASTSLLFVLGMHSNWNDHLDRDGLKHLPAHRVGDVLQRITGVVVFLRAPAEEVIDSLHKRGYCRAQAFKLSGGLYQRLRIFFSTEGAVHGMLTNAFESQEREVQTVAAKRRVLILEKADVQRRKLNALARLTGIPLLELNQAIEKTLLES